MTKKNSSEKKGEEKDNSKRSHHPSFSNINLLKSSHEPISVERNQKILMVQTSPRAEKKKVCDLEEIK